MVMCPFVVLSVALSSVCNFRSCMGEVLYQFAHCHDQEILGGSSYLQSHYRLNNTYEYQFLSL